MKNLHLYIYSIKRKKKAKFRESVVPEFFLVRYRRTYVLDKPKNMRQNVDRIAKFSVVMLFLSLDHLLFIPQKKSLSTPVL